MAPIHSEVKVLDVRTVHRERTWRLTPFVLSYILLASEPSGAQLAAVYRWALKRRLPNPRVIAPSVLQWSSLFNPRFYAAVNNDRSPGSQMAVAAAPPLHVNVKDGERLSDSPTRFWVESVLFLATVTMSAAIIQSRWSPGTIASKYDRIWQAADLAAAGVLTGLEGSSVRDAVSDLVAQTELGDLDRLIVIRRLLEHTIQAISVAPTAQAITMRPTRLPSHLADRFGFVDELTALAGTDHQAVIVYGSSTSGDDFADYDVIVVSRYPEEMLRSLAGRSPSWRGKELNIGVYSPTELWRLQLLSGDNLASYGVCISGEVDVPVKARGHLLLRNLSFGAVRQRQQLGMVGEAIRCPQGIVGDDRRNLYEYFVKIPSNVAKGTFGAVGDRRSKRQVYKWVRNQVGYDTAAQQGLVLAGRPGKALACAAVATGGVMREANKCLGGIVQTT